MIDGHVFSEKNFHLCMHHSSTISNIIRFFSSRCYQKQSKNSFGIKKCIIAQKLKPFNKIIFLIPHTNVSILFVFFYSRSPIALFQSILTIGKDKIWNFQYHFKIMKSLLFFLDWQSFKDFLQNIAFMHLWCPYLYETCIYMCS